MNKHPYLRLIRKNTFTLFNFVNLVLAAMIFFVGSYKNMLFIVIALANTLISIINGIRAQKIIDKLKLISEQNPTIERQGQIYQVPPAQIQKGDLLILGLGDQIQFDSQITEGTIEVNESYVTGESDNITKRPGDKLISGSFIVAGQAKATVTAVGSQNSLNKLEQAAHTIQPADSKLFKIMNDIVKYISYTLIPIGALLLWARFRVPDTTTEVAVTSTVAGLINMIPEGLILLTSSVLALATIRLARQKVLVQDLYSIETLARVDTLCLDKTGTLTTGNLKVGDLIPAASISKNTLQSTIESILSLVPADNATSRALHAKFARGAKNRATAQNTKTKNAKNVKDTAQDYELIPFSSDRKYSGIKNDREELLIGALEFLTTDPALLAQAPDTDKRVLAVVRRDLRAEAEEDLSQGVRSLARRGLAREPRGDGSERRAPREVLLGFVALEDELRKDIKPIINFFYDNDVDIKIISGDAPHTVQSVATTVGVKTPTVCDLSTTSRHNYRQLVQDYNIFARVTPAQKKQLIEALKKQNRTVAMTGDGVNDILAMKEADCSIAIGHGSDAARRSAKLVLLDSDFAAVPAVIKEGRQSINNLERSTSLFLAKTVYAAILAVLFCILPLEYPYSPIEMSLLNFACIGFPGVILALEPNIARIKDQFLSNILTYSVPTGITVSFAAIALAVAAHLQDFSHAELTTMSVFVTFAIDLVLIYWISRPLNPLRAGLIAVIVAIFALAFSIPAARSFFDFTTLSLPAIITTACTLAAALAIFNLARLILRRFAPQRGSA